MLTKCAGFSQDDNQNEQDFSQEQPVELDAYDWYVLLTGLDEQAAPFQGMDGNRHYAQDTSSSC